MLLEANAFVVEDGTGLTNATSYTSDIEALNYLDNTLRGLSNDRFRTASTADKKKYLNFSTLFLDNRFDFLGTKTKATQSLEFPRSSEDGNKLLVPNKIKYASIELAIIMASDLLFDDRSVGSQIISERISEIEIKYSDVTRKDYKVVRYNFIKNLISDYLVYTDSSPFERA